jgi:hypothetical protein
MLNNKVSQSLQFNQLPNDTCRLLATWTIAHLDVNGVFYADPAIVRSLIFPRRTDISAEDVAGYLDAMEAVGLIERYEANGDLWQRWPGFQQNQPGLRADRETAQYPPYSDNDAGFGPPESRDLPQDGGENPAEVEGEAKEKLREGEESAADAPPASPVPPQKTRRKREPKTPTPAAVTTFREEAHRYPAKSWYTQLQATIGDGVEDIAFWRQVVHEWVGCGYNPTNVAGMLDCYRNRTIPRTGGGKNNGRSNDGRESAPIPVVRFSQAAIDEQKRRLLECESDQRAVGGAGGPAP